MHYLAYISIKGVILFIIGIYIRYRIGKRHFRRRAMTGLEYFSSYGKMILIRVIEGLFSLASICLLIIGGYLLVSKAIQLH